MTIVTPRVLLVDDCQEDRETYRRYLQRDQQYTYRILEATTGEEALFLCRQQFPDVILLDYLLPDVNGLEFLNELTTQLGQTKLPIIVLTGQGDEQVAVQVMKSGAADYLVKRNTTSESLRLAIQNVLERTRLSGQLEESEARFQATFNQAAVGIAHVGQNGQWLLVNQKFCDIVGYSPEELNRLTLEDITYPDDINADLEYVRQILANEIQTYSVEKRYIRKDKAYIWINLTVSLVRKPSGELKNFIFVIQDISERKQLEEALHHTNEELEQRVAKRTTELVQANSRLQQEIKERKQAEEHLCQSEEQRRLVLDLTNTGFWNWNLTTGEIFWNDNHYHLLGLVPNQVEVNYQMWRDRVHPDDIERVEQAIHYALDTQTEYEAEYRVVHPDGSHHWLMARGRGLYNESNQAVRMIGMLFDISDRKQSEEALKQSEARYRTLAEAIPQMIWVADADGFSYDFNEQFQTYLGMTIEEIRGHGWLSAVHPAHVQSVMTLWQEALQNSTPYNVEYRLRRADGVYRWHLVRALPMRDSENQVVAWIGSCTDVNDLKQAEDELKKMSAALSNAVEGISQLDVQGRYMMVNQAYANAVGYQPEEMIGMAWQQTVHPEDIEMVMSAYQQILSAGKVEVEARGIRKDSSIFYKQLTMIPTLNKHKQFVGHYCFMKDISERQAALRERKQAEQKIREQAALLDITTDAIFVRDLSYRILYWNSGAERLYGWLAAEVIGRNCCEFLYKQISPQTEEAFRTVVEQGEWQGELNQLAKSGQEIIAQTRWTLMRDEAGKPKSILSVDTDITEKKQLQAQFYRAQRLESLGTLASGIAHDLNNILTPIIAVAQLLPLKVPNLDGQNRQLLKILEDNSKRGADLVKQITAFARGAEGRRIPLQPRHLLKEIEQVVKSTFPKSIEICIHIPTSNLWTILADPTQIHQVLMNLCVNARDAMANGGTLSLSAKNFHVDENYARMNLEAKAGNYVLVTVSDTGCGIPPDLLERIFEPFFTTKEPGKGTGLGLSTVIGIIKNHGGFVSVYSEVGKGSQFKLFLSAINTSTTQEANDSQAVRGNGELILVVDDEKFIRDIAKTSLEEFGYRVLIASDGIEAFSLYAQHKDEISLVLMDIQMPSIDGFQAIRILQQINPSVKIIVISGLTSNHKLLEASSIHVQAFLPKPYTIKELLDTINDVLSVP
ncbi:PAS domain S-box protein [Chlorogloeopsis sp. ULAP01]|uniref:PAS domain S-box protein n=1 Tax=Chlorogloeopsis sp. ULAP01 TaxID=3056483 RepID=UPI0025AA4A56|nr:PAS domain S-box protein [Chlorogloeopsis sp. ULAP01]MDM9384227.1 PAS domain S-box protein [Chlorogloeopsis sp. ULAP01]